MPNRGCCVGGPSAAEDGQVGFSDAAGSSIRSIATIFAPVIVNSASVIGLPSAAVTTPAAPSMSAGRVTWAIRVKGNARPATAAAPRTASVPLDRTTTSGSSASSSASKSPLRAASRKVMPAERADAGIYAPWPPGRARREAGRPMPLPGADRAGGRVNSAR
jgi:hypothetical protein